MSVTATTQLVTSSARHHTDTGFPATMGFHFTDVGIFASLFALCFYGRPIGRFLYQFFTFKIPGPSFWELITVHAKYLLGDDMVLHATKLCATYNFKPWGLWVPSGVFLIFVSDCESSHAVYRSKNTTDKPRFFYEQLTEFLGRNLITMNGPEYSRHRRAFNTGLQKSLQDSFLQRMSAPMSDFIAAVRKEAAGGADVDLRDLVKWHVMSASTVSLTSVSHETAPINFQRTASAVPRRTELAQIKAINPLHYYLLNMKPSSKQNREMCEAAVTGFNDIWVDEIARALRSDDSRDVFQAVIHTFLKMGNDEKSQREMGNHGLVIWITGEETSTFLVQTLLVVLALYQDVQRRVCDEIELVLGENEGPIFVDELDRLEYTDMVIKETIRLFPPVPMLARRVRKETDLNGVVAPKGSVVVVNLLALHRNPEYFPDPMKFDPERFTAEASKGRPPYSFIPFSSGSRSCPGKIHAYTMAKLFLCHILRNFSILPGDRLKSLDDIKVKMAFTMNLQDSSLRFVDRRSKRV